MKQTMNNKSLFYSLVESIKKHDNNSLEISDEDEYEGTVGNDMELLNTFLDYLLKCKENLLKLIDEYPEIYYDVHDNQNIGEPDYLQKLNGAFHLLKSTQVYQKMEKHRNENNYKIGQNFKDEDELEYDGPKFNKSDYDYNEYKKGNRAFQYANAKNRLNGYTKEKDYHIDWDGYNQTEYYDFDVAQKEDSDMVLFERIKEILNEILISFKSFIKSYPELKYDLENGEYPNDFVLCLEKAKRVLEKTFIIKKK